MTARLTYLRATLGLCLGTALAVACSATNDNSSSGSDNSSQGGSGASGGQGGEGASFMGSGGNSTISVGQGGGCGNTCSADLKSVVDCNGVVVQQCPGDEACLNGACGADPCDAAEASKSSYGCEYYPLKTDIIVPEGDGACFAAFVANTWSSPVHLDVSYNGMPITNTGFIGIPQGQGQNLTYAPYNAATGLPVGEVAVLFLSEGPGGGLMPDCPLPAAVQAEAGLSGTGYGNAFTVSTDRPIVAYQIIPFGGGSAAATSATLLLPTSAWDTNYVAVNAYAKSAVAGPAQPSLAVLAGEDNTTVTILPKAPIVGGGGIAPSPANVATTYTINKGQYLQISQDTELTGSPIQADKPVAVFGAASCLNVPVTAYACDTAHQQIPPVKALGSEYAGVRYRNRQGANGEETPPWRVVGAVDGTQLTWTPSAPAGAPSVLNLGDVVEFNAAGPLVVKSQDSDHPFYLAQYMTGGDMFGGEGDPEWVNVIPVAQYLDEYVFFTDPTYSETELVVVRRRSKATGNFEDVNIACGGVLGGWQAVGEHEYTRLPLVTGDFMDVNGCSNGRQEMSSSAPFGVTVWGWGGYSQLFTQYVSYAYPAGASVQPINEVVVPPTPK